MTLTLELAPEEERALKAKAQRNGQTLDELLHDLIRHEAQRETEVERQASIAGRLAALDAIPTFDTRSGLPPLDLSGTRSDVYGYAEREDAQL